MALQKWMEGKNEGGVKRNFSLTLEEDTSRLIVL